MRAFAGFSLAFAAALLVSGAQATPQYPAGAAALEAQLLATQPPDALAWIKDEAGFESTNHILSAETPRNAARKYGASGSDVSKLAFLVLMQAARDAESNVSQLVSGVQAAAASRQDVRQQSMANNGIAGAQQSQLSGGLQTAQQAQGSTFISIDPRDNNADPIKAAIDKARAEQATPIPPPSMTLQDAMDRETQIEDLLPQAMKNIQGG